MWRGETAPIELPPIELAVCRQLSKMSYTLVKFLHVSKEICLHDVYIPRAQNMLDIEEFRKDAAHYAQNVIVHISDRAYPYNPAEPSYETVGYSPNMRYDYLSGRFLYRQTVAKKLEMMAREDADKYCKSWNTSENFDIGSLIATFKTKHREWYMKRLFDDIANFVFECMSDE